MKKVVFMLALMIVSIPVFNQEQSENILMNKNGINILPEKGEMAIGIDAVPLLNLLNNKGATAGFNFVNNIPSIRLKYFNTDNSAIRINLLLRYNSVKDGNESFTNFDKTTENSFGLSAGWEKRTGKSRVQGYYGFDVGFSYGKSKEIDQNNNVSIDISSLVIGANGIIGVEYFIAPKLSLGGEFTWGPTYTSIKDIDNRTALSSISVSAGNANGALILAFHF